MMKAETQSDALSARNTFEKLFVEKYPKAFGCQEKSWLEMTTFFNFPALHWQHIRTTNPIETSFTTVKLRTKGAGSKKTAAVMAFNS